MYSLGVLLYELLTGTTPVDRKSLGQAALLEILRIVREVEAPRPSAKLSSSETLPSVAANRGTEAGKLSKLMRGELDWVVLRALEKDRSRRYDTANALARDVQRYLADEVVEARPPSTGYRLRKFLRRHKGQVLAAGLVLLTLVAGIVVSAYFAFDAMREAQRANDNKQLADDKADLATREAKRAKDAADGEARQKTIAEGNAAEAKAEAKRADDEKKIAQWNERLAKDSNHAIKLDLAMRAREQSDWARMGQLLAETHADYGQTLENRLVKALWVKHAFPLKDLVGHAVPVTSVAFSPDGKRIATGGGGADMRGRPLPGEVKVWDAETGTEKFALKGHTLEVQLGVLQSRRQAHPNREPGQDGARVGCGHGHGETHTRGAPGPSDLRMLQPRRQAHRHGQRGQDGARLGHRHGRGDRRPQWAHGLGDLRVLQPRRQAHRYGQRGQDGTGVGRGDGNRDAGPQGNRGPGSLRVLQPRRQAHRHGWGQSCCASKTDSRRGEGVGRGHGDRRFSPSRGTQVRCVLSAAFSLDGKRIVTGELEPSPETWSPAR